jgi:hypothetical protein
MKVTVNYCYYHKSRDIGGDYYSEGCPAYIPTFLEGQIDRNFNILVATAHRTIDPFLKNTIVSLQEVVKVHHASGADKASLCLTCEDPYALDGIKTVLQSFEEAFYV